MPDSEINWITLEEASEISGASVAIIQDTIRKYQNNPEAFKTRIENGVCYIDKNQMLNIFSASSNPQHKEKIPGTLFRWFDDLRKAYETSMNTMLRRVETVKDDHRLDLQQNYQQQLSQLEKNYQQQLDTLQQSQLAQIKLLKRNILRLEKDADFYQQQVITQQETIAQLNSRYDAVILALKDKQPQLEKDITPNKTYLNTENNGADTTTLSAAEHKKKHGNDEYHQNKTPVYASTKAFEVEDDQQTNDDQLTSSSMSKSTNESGVQVQPPVPQSKHNQQKVEGLLKSAYQARNDQEFTLARELFEQAALLGCNKAMGALGKSFYTGEGVKQNIEKSIAWLYLAAEYQFEPAKLKIAQFKKQYPEQYQHGLELANAYAIQIKLNQNEENASYVET